MDRRGQGKRIIFTIAAVVILQALYLAGFNLARQSNWGLILIYVIVFMPIMTGGFLLTGAADRARRALLYRKKNHALEGV